MRDDERQALINSIREFHADDTPRLMFADALEADGDQDRADFIRLQCEYARPSGCKHCLGKRNTLGTDDDVFDAHACANCSLELSMKIDRLMTGQHRNGWANHVAWAGANHVAWAGAAASFGNPRVDFTDHNSDSYHFERGFLVWVGAEWRKFDACGEQVMKEHPVRRVRFYDTPNPSITFEELRNPENRTIAIAARWKGGGIRVEVGEREMALERSSYRLAVARQEVREKAVDAYLDQRFGKIEFTWTTREWRNYTVEYTDVSRDDPPRGVGVGPT